MPAVAGVNDVTDIPSIDGMASQLHCVSAVAGAHDVADIPSVAGV